MKKELRASAFLLLTAVIWGFAMAFQREGSRFLPPFSFNASRSLVAAAVMLPLMLLDGKRTGRKITRRDALSGAIVGCVLFLASFLQQLGVGQTGAGKTGFITAMYVVLVPVLGAFFGKKTGLFAWLALLLAVPALYLLCVEPGEKMTVAPMDALLLFSAVCWAGHILVTDHFVSRTPALALCFFQYAASALLNLLCAAAWETPTLAGVQGALIPILYCGVLSTGLGYACQTVGQKNSRPAVAALILSLESVFCVLAGALMLGESMSGRGYLGCGLMLAAVALAQVGSLTGIQKEKTDV